MVMTSVALSEAAVTVLQALGAEGLARRYREVLRRRGRKALMLAARLRAELMDALDAMEERQIALRRHIQRRRAPGGDPAGGAAPGCDPAVVLHDRIMTALRARVEESYDGLEELDARQIEARCVTLVAVAGDVAALVSEIEGCEVTWGVRAERHPRPRRGVGARHPVTGPILEGSRLSRSMA